MCQYHATVKGDINFSGLEYLHHSNPGLLVYRFTDENLHQMQNLFASWSRNY